MRTSHRSHPVPLNPKRWPIPFSHTTTIAHAIIESQCPKIELHVSNSATLMLFYSLSHIEKRKSKQILESEETVSATISTSKHFRTVSCRFVSTKIFGSNEINFYCGKFLRTRTVKAVQSRRKLFRSLSFSMLAALNSCS